MRNPSSSSSSSAAAKTPCCSKVGLKRGPWTPEEDELLASYIKREGEGRWRTLPKRAGLLRCGKSCRLRWMNYLRPSVKRGQIAPDEEDLILRLHRLLGNSNLSKKLISQGIDPRTHKPLSTDQNNSSEGATPTTVKASTSKANRSRRSPNPSPSPVSSGLEEASSGSQQEAIHKENVPLQSTNNLETAYQNGTPVQGQTSTTYLPLSSDHFQALGLRSSHGLSTEEDGDLNCCGDDVFSSFLNSLINEEAFPIQHQLQQHSLGVSAPTSDPLISVTPSAFGITSGWESSIVSSMINQDSNNGVNNEIE